MCDKTGSTIDLREETSSDNSVIIIDDDSISKKTNENFIIDIKQCDESSLNSALLESDNQQFYNGEVVTHLFVPDTKISTNKKNTTCFNCLGEHSLKDCTTPRDGRRISRNRFNIKCKKRDSIRLHENQSTEMLYKPGVLSDNLRKALGIGTKDIPEWIYRMRKKGFIFGYPPAYLKRATEKNVLSFVTDDKGEDDQEIIDPEKLHVYPGFNKYDPHLNDYEKFEIPSWKKFVGMHQSALNERNKLKKECLLKNLKEQSKKHLSEPKKKKKRANNKIEEGGVVDDLSFCTTTNNSITKTPVNSNNCDKKNKNLFNKETLILKGTPILLNKSISENQYNHEIEKPSLENFAKDIVPFQHQNITEECGFFTKICNIVKNLKKTK